MAPCPGALQGRCECTARVSGFFASATQNLDRSGEKYPGRGRGQEGAARAAGRLVRATVLVGALASGPGCLGREAQGSCNGICC